MKRLGYGLVGAFLGAIISIEPLAWLFDYWILGVMFCSLIVAVLSAVFGERVIIFIRNHFLGGPLD